MSTTLALPAGEYKIITRDSDGETELEDSSGGVWDPNSIYPWLGDWEINGVPVLYEQLTDGSTATLLTDVFLTPADADLLRL